MKGPDPSPHEFPIFNVSHNPEAPYPNPINHLYDKRYKEAYSTFIKQNPSTPSPATVKKNDPPPPPSPTSPPSTQSPPYPAHQQVQFQRQTSKPTPQPPPSGNVLPSNQQPPIGWQFVNPYATMPRSHAAYYQQQAARMMPPIQEQPSANPNQPVRHSSTGEDIQPRPISRSASNNDLNYPTNSGAEKIRVRVINDNSTPSSPSSANPPVFPNHRATPQRSILKPQGDPGNNQEPARTRIVYAPPNSEIGTETMEDLFKVVNNQRSEPSGSGASPMTERVIIIDRRGSGTPDNNSNSSGKERYRAFEIRSSAAPNPSPSPTTTTPAAPLAQSASATSAAYVTPRSAYNTGQQMFYQQPKMYGSVPSSIYSPATPYVMGANSFYPFTYYHY